jgi:hypothetical protein
VELIDWHWKAIECRTTIPGSNKEIEMRLVVLAISVTLAFLLSIGWQPSTLAGLLIVNSGHGGIQLNPAGGVPGLDNVVGYSFKPISNHLIATAFGFWDAQQDGIPTSMLLGLWDSATDELLASALLPSGIGTRLEGEFRFVPPWSQCGRLGTDSQGWRADRIE